jgi:GcrA cell cycle regulator
MTVLTWTDDRVEQLKKLWEAGLSASQIAAELGSVTRNAVIGKVHRLGLSGRAKSPSSSAPRQRKVRPAQHMMRVNRPISRGNTALAHAFELEMEPDPIAFDNVVPMSQRRTLLELNEATCHWPIGDPSSSEFLVARRCRACLIARTTHASPISRPVIAAGNRRSPRVEGLVLGARHSGTRPFTALANAS